MNDTDLLEELTREFGDQLLEARELLPSIRNGDSAVDVDRVDAIFRTIHSLKGISDCLGLRSISQLSSGLEHVLHGFREQNFVPDQHTLNAMFEALEELQAMVAEPADSESRYVLHQLDQLATLKGDGCETSQNSNSNELSQLRSEPESHRSSSTINFLSPGKPDFGVDGPGNVGGTQPVTDPLRLSDSNDELFYLRRYVEYLCHELGKRCELVIENDGQDLEASVLRTIRSSLTHLVRNALAHGIEPPDVRLAAGKPVVGDLRISAGSDDQQTWISVSDDGAGINVERLKQQAVALGILSQEKVAAMDYRQAVQLIFCPGISSKSEVTACAGHGVGMDAVQATVRSLGGSVEVSSTPAVGTEVKMILPAIRTCPTAELASQKKVEDSDSPADVSYTPE